jgi:CheY-like chemotaxis protein
VSEHPKSSRDPASTREPIVFVIDDDASMRRALTNLFESVGLEVEVFCSAAEMLQSKLPEVASCLVLDIQKRWRTIRGRGRQWGGSSDRIGHSSG